MSGSFAVDNATAQFTFQLKPPAANNNSAPGNVAGSAKPIFNFTDPLSNQLRHLHLDLGEHLSKELGDLNFAGEQPAFMAGTKSSINSHDANEFDQDFEAAWGSKLPKKPLPISQVWLPNSSQPRLIAPNSANTKSHLHIGACAKCNFGTCLACGVAPHLKECTFSDSRAAWEALCSVDEAIISFHTQSPHLPINHATREILPTLLQCLKTLNTTVARNGALTFGFDQLLRKSMLLDVVADFMQDMTVQNMELTPLLIQILEFLHMLAENITTRNLFFERRQVLKAASPGLRTLAFPLVLLPVQQVSSYNWNDQNAKSFTLWPVLQRCLKVAQQYMHENNDDVWSGALVALAQRVPDVYALVASSVPQKPLKLMYTHYTQHELGYAIGLRELFAVAVAKKAEAKKVAVQEDTSSMETEPPLKKRGRARAWTEVQGSNGVMQAGQEREELPARDR
ncbi:hypothetical protein H4I96_11282 [Botrytis cinerea]